MKNICVAAAVALSVVVPAIAEQTPQPPTTVAAFVRARYTARKNEIVRAAEKMPEEFYGLRPGPQVEVRTFGQHLAHIASFNFLWCSEARGEKNPNAGMTLEKTLSTKAEFLKALGDSYTYCDAAYTALTDASGAEVLTITQESGRQVQLPRMGLLILNLGHNDEVYGSMVTTMRIKSIVPPASEPRSR
ncbi:MAG TPA: DinB family protein [Vicinamibacterales bacterium]